MGTDVTYTYDGDHLAMYTDILYHCVVHLKPG